MAPKYHYTRGQDNIQTYKSSVTYNISSSKKKIKKKYGGTLFILLFKTVQNTEYGKILHHDLSS